MAKKKPTFEFEAEMAARGCKRIAGVDEVGRGCLAGPVVAAAVILPKSHTIVGLNDSKALSPQKREFLYEEIFKQASAIGIGTVSPEVIDEINILQASLRAMRRAIEALDPAPDFLLVDGNLPSMTELPQKSIVKGDQKSQSIAAASIVAKVFRDHLMANYGYRYPQYEWASNKGYPTASHLMALKKHGVTNLHRKSFRGVREILPI